MKKPEGNFKLILVKFWKNSGNTLFGVVTGTLFWDFNEILEDEKMPWRKFWSNANVNEV